MKKIITGIVPLLLAALTFYLTKPSDETCKEEGISRLATINIKASADSILVKDYVVVKAMKYVANGDTLPLGTGFFFQVKVNDRKLENITKHQKPAAHAP